MTAVAAIYATTTGCTSTEIARAAGITVQNERSVPFHGEPFYFYVDMPGSMLKVPTYRFETPLEFAADATDSEKGMQVAVMPYTKPESGLTFGAAGVAAVTTGTPALLLLDSGPGIPPTDLGRVICFEPKATTPSESAAVSACLSSIEHTSSKALKGAEWTGIRYRGTVDTSSGPQEAGIGPYADTFANWVVDGFAPADKGGQPSYIVSISTTSQPSYYQDENTLTVQELASAIAKVKPANVVFILAAKNDYREQSGLPPVVAY